MHHTKKVCSYAYCFGGPKILELFRWYGVFLFVLFLFFVFCCFFFTLYFSFFFLFYTVIYIWPFTLLTVTNYFSIFNKYTIWDTWNMHEGTGFKTITNFRQKYKYLHPSIFLRRFRWIKRVYVSFNVGLVYESCYLWYKTLVYIKHIHIPIIYITINVSV